MDTESGAQNSGVTERTVFDFLRGVEALSAREFSVFSLILLGSSTKRIADQLDISRRTVDSHRVRILQKLNVSNMNEAFSLLLSAYCLGMVEECEPLRELFEQHAKRLRELN